MEQSLQSPSQAIAQGLLPLELQGSHRDSWNVAQNFSDVLAQVANASIYPGGETPPADVQAKRVARIIRVQQTLSEAALATYDLSSDYTLGEISEIFETLNTTGVRISTVDLIHSLNYKDTTLGSQQPFQVREWLDDLGELQGARGWASSTDKPERVAQIVTASYIGLAQKMPGRTLSRERDVQPIGSIKANDMLRTPALYWVSRRADLPGLAGDVWDCPGHQHVPGNRPSPSGTTAAG